MTTIRNTSKTFFSWLLFLTVLTISGCSPVPAPATLPVPPEAVESNDFTGEGMRVHFLDVGQGDCGLIESDGRYLLIDAGERDQSEQIIRYLEDSGVTRLDYVIGTHPHSDHIGGLADVIRHFDIGKVILPPKEHTTRTFEYLLDTMAEKQLKITKPVVGTTYELGGASFTIIAPNDDYGDDLNNWSVGIRLDYGSTSFLFTGDAEAGAEADICSNGLPIKADVIKLGHHGSSTSNSRTFLEQANPSYGVISCGTDNSYGHPHKEVLDDLSALGIQVFRTDQMGTITAISDGSRISWQTADSAPETSVPASAATQPESEYILNTGTKKIHKPDCSSVRQIGDENKKSYTGTLDQLNQQGYTPCKNCKP